MKPIIFKKLSFAVQGILFAVQKQLGGNYHEKYYQRAIQVLLEKSGIPFQKEAPINIEIEGRKIGHHFLDFVIDNKIVLEVKQGRRPTRSDIHQVLMYLRSSGKPLGIIAAFHSAEVTIKRVINADAVKFRDVRSFREFREKG